MTPAPAHRIGSLGFDPVVVEVPCGREAHRVSWEDGALRPLDHDVVAERALEALAGTAPYCVRLHDAWRSFEPMGRDARIIVALVAPEGLTKEGAAQLMDVHRNRARGGIRHIIGMSEKHFPEWWRGRTRIDVHPMEANSKQLVLLAEQPRPLRLRYAAGLVTRAMRSPSPPEADALLRGGLELCVDLAAAVAYRRAARTWGRRTGVVPPAPYVWGTLPPRAVPCFEVRGRGKKPIAALPVDWLLGVWLHDLGSIAGRFVLSIDGRSGERSARLLDWRIASHGSAAPHVTTALIRRSGARWKILDP